VYPPRSPTKLHPNVLLGPGDNAFLRPRDGDANQRRTSLRRGGCASQPSEPQNDRGRRSYAPPVQSNGRGRPTAPQPGWSDRSPTDLDTPPSTT